MVLSLVDICGENESFPYAVLKHQEEYQFSIHIEMLARTIIFHGTRDTPPTLFYLTATHMRMQLLCLRLGDGDVQHAHTQLTRKKQDN